MEFEVDLLGEKFFVYDLDTSLTPDHVGNTFSSRSPFTMLKDPRVVVDIGANVGVWAFWVAKRYPQCHVYAVEPHQVSIMNLQLGIMKNQLPNVTVIPCAVSHKPEIITLWMQMQNSGACGIFNNVFAGTVPVRAAAIPLNTLFETINEHEIDHVKVDIEGPEFNLFHRFSYWSRIASLEVEAHPWPQFRDKRIAIAEVQRLTRAIANAMKGKPYEILSEINKEHYPGP